ncbi:type II toxin-antitoxin system HicA family toxin [Novosphingobium pokkalii]|uniref:type II toxin-antitoxin system HicA family toxin n=1 Tax=Novosphingobium pokkalii TaxID=1770194 RepID=UPI00174B8F98
MADYYRDIIALLRDAGCHFVRNGKGDHEIWYSPISNRNFTVDKKVKVRHTANGTLQDAGLDKAF